MLILQYCQSRKGIQASNHFSPKSVCSPVWALSDEVLMSLRRLNRWEQYQALCITIHPRDMAYQHKGKVSVSEEKEIVEKCLIFFLCLAHTFALVVQCVTAYVPSEEFPLISFRAYSAVTASIHPSISQSCIYSTSTSAVPGVFQPLL